MDSPAIGPTACRDPVAYVLSANLARRHMSKGQRAMAGAMVAVLTKSAQREVASTTKVDAGYVGRAAVVLSADPDLAAQVLAGTIPLNEAYSTIQARNEVLSRPSGDDRPGGGEEGQRPCKRGDQSGAKNPINHVYDLIGRKEVARIELCELPAGPFLDYCPHDVFVGGVGDGAYTLRALTLGDGG